MPNVFMTVAKNVMVDAEKAVINAISLHTADPGTSGASEVSGGSPAYARKVPSWAASSNGEAALSAQLVFDIPAGATVAWVGFWASGVFHGKAQLGASETFGAQGTYTLTTATKLSVTDPA